jgi:acyl carrier protein phosphodiesterase
LNFLAHLWLADQTGTSLAGSVLGDFIHGRIPDDFPADLATGIALHRRIDASTDRHPLSVAARAQFANGQRRYAGILLDVVHDHLLATHWQEFSAETLEDFTARAAREVADAAEWFMRAGGFSPRQSEFQMLLQSYANLDGIERAIHRTAQRMRAPEGLMLAADGWPELVQTLSPGLPVLLKDLRLSARQFLELDPG